jgi:hypothetical protein
MRRILQLTATAAFLIQAFNLTAQSFNYLGSFDSQGVPGYLTMPSDVIQTDFLGRIRNSLPENYPVPQYNPQYLLDTVGTDIRVRDSVDLWITFVDEGASYLNSFAFYTYTGTNPTKPKNLTVIFPNMSLPGSGGNLQRGHKVYLGRFPGGTNVGFALMADGFKPASGNKAASVTKGNNIFYSTDKFNPESNASHKRHTVLLRDMNGTIVIGFEDLRRDQGADNDFNDAILYITASNRNNVITDNVNGTYGSGTVSSGNNGGLESNGTLANAIAIRNFQRSKTPSVDYNNPDKLESFIEVKKGALETRGDVEMEQFIPQQPFITPSSAYISTPKDLLGITNAKKVIAVDYFDDVTAERCAAVLSSKTDNRVYDHSKITCDRLIGSALEHAEVIMINDIPFVRTALSRPDGTFEYAISFSMYNSDATTANIVSRWSVDDYPEKPAFWNFQVWSEAPHMTQKLVEEILIKIKNQYPNIVAAEAAKIPQVFVKKGTYDNGVLTLTVFNPLQAKTLTINGNMTATETSKRITFTQQLALKGEAEEIVKINVGTVYDMGFSVKNDKAPEADILYFADGVWGIDYDRATEKIETFAVKNSIPSLENGIYTVERDPQLRGVVKGYVSLFRSLRPASEAVDMSTYKNLSFTASGTGVAEVTLVKKSVKEWAKHYRTEIKLTGEKQDYRLSLNQFANADKTPLNADDLVSVVFTIKGDGKTEEPFEINVENMAFDNKEIKVAELTGDIAIYPNPVTETATLSFKMEERSNGVIRLVSLQGQTVYEKNDNFAKGRNDIKLDLTQLPRGVYIANISTGKGMISTKINVQ